MATLEANALSLTEYANMSNDQLISGMAMAFVKHNAILQDIPFVGKKSLHVNFARFEDGLPTPTWVKINETGNVHSGTAVQRSAQAYIIRDYVKTDHVLMEDENAIGNPHQDRVELYLMGRSFDFNDKFINNSHVTGNADSIVGLKSMLDNPLTYGLKSGNKMNGSATLTTAATAANLNAFQEKLDEWFYQLQSPNGDGIVIYANDKFLRRFDSLLRIHSGAGGFGVATDQYGRSVRTYKNAIFRDAGYKADQSSKIITSTEDSTGAAGASTYTSLYAVKYGVGDFFGWMFGMQAKNIDEPNGVLKSTFLEMVMGVVPKSPWCIGRLYGLNLG